MNYKKASDIELWQHCLLNHMGAYNELFSRYYPRMFQLASRHITDTMKAEELCMDQLFNLWVKRNQITITSNFSGYLFRSIRNLVITELRKKVPVMYALEKVKDEYQLDRSSDYNLRTEEAEQAYRDTLNALSPQRRRVFILSREENLTYSQIAERLDLSINTVENYMVAALRIFRKSMEEYATPALIPLLLLTDFPTHIMPI